MCWPAKQTFSTTTCRSNVFDENWIIHYRQKHGIFGKHWGNTRIRHFDLLEMAWHHPQTCIVTIIQYSRVVLWTKNVICNVRNLKKQTKIYSDVSFLILSLKCPTMSGVSITTGSLVCMCRMYRSVYRHVLSVFVCIGMGARACDRHIPNVPTKPIGTFGTRGRLSPLAWWQVPIA